MYGILVRWLLSTFSLLLAAYLVEGIEVAGFFPALLAAALLGVLNAFVRPVFIVITLPINILTLGLFTWVINGLMLMMVSGVIGGFYVDGFWPALWGSLILGLINWLANIFIGGRGKVEVIDLRIDKRNRWS
jgi:putative membrane protein